MGPSNKLSCEAGSFSCHLNPHRFFNLVRGVEALFSCTGTLGCMVCLALQLFLPVYLQANVGLTAAPAATSLCPPAITLPTLVLQLLPCHKSSPPYCPSLDECLFFKKEDFHTVQFYGSSGYFLFLICCCSSFGFVKRQSVSTYASILAGNLCHILMRKKMFQHLALAHHLVPLSCTETEVDTSASQ